MAIRQLSFLATCTSLFALTAFAAHAANFTIVSGETETTTQTLGPGTSETGLVEAGGTLTVGSGDAIVSTSVGGSITNNGTINENDSFRYGINTAATGQIAINNGIINANPTSGFDAYGMGSTVSGNNRLINNGTITIGPDAVGMGNFDANINDAVYINNGTIVTRSNVVDEIVAMGSLSHNVTFINNGTVTVNADVSADMLGGAIGGTIINTGHLNFTGDNGWGIYMTGANSSALNTGTIIVTGTGDNGMHAQADNVTLTNRGVVTNIGSGQGILADHANVLIVNRGIVTSTGGDAIEMTGNNATLVLGGNSIVNGNIAFGGAGGALQYDVSGTGRAGSVIEVNGTIIGSPATSITGTIPQGARMAQSGGTLAVVTPDNFAMGNEIVGQALNYASDLITRRQQLALLGDTTGVAGGTQYAASTATLNDASPTYGWGAATRKAVWAEGFGTYQERGSSGEAPSSTVRTGGMLGGIDLPQSDNGYRIGFYGGGFTGSLHLNPDSFRAIDSNGVLAGGYIGHSYENYFVSAQLATGYSSNDSDRFTGIDTASASYNSYFVSPSLTVTRPFAGDGVTWIPSLNLNYLAQFDDSYHESGSAANQSVGARTLQSLGARAILEAVLDERQWKGGMLQPSFRAGIRGQALAGGNDVSVNTLGNALTFDPRGGMNTLDGIMGINLSYAMENGPRLYSDGEANLGLNKGGPAQNKGITAQFGSRWQF